MRVVSRPEAVIVFGSEVGWVVENIEDANVGELLVQRLAELCQRLCKEVLGSASLERWQVQVRAWGVPIPVWSRAWRGCWGEVASPRPTERLVRL